jgi:hypothetical protein
MSTLWLEVIDSVQDDNSNWKITFPRKFPIVGSGQYNSPLKLEMKDPYIIRLIDH